MKTRIVVFICCCKFINRVGLLFIFLGLSYLLYAQAESEKGLPFITNYSAKTFNALPQTWCVQQDENGLMYFGVQNFILEYDGLKWRKLHFPNTSSSNVCRSMAKSKNGVIYYGAFGDIGYLSNDSLGQKQTYSLLNLVPVQYRNFLDVWSTYTTGSGVYFQSREYILRYDYPKTGSKTKQVMKVWTPKTKFMYAFYLDGDYYVHQQGEGLYKMINDSLVLIPGSEFLGKERMQIMLPYTKTTAGENQYLIGLFYSGLYLFNGHTFQPFATKADPIIKSGFNLYKGIQLSNGNYVLSTTGKGLAIIDAKGNLLQKINRDVGLQDESIYGEFVDKKGSLWLALDNGISRVEIASPLTKFGLQSGITTGVLSINRFEGDLYIGMSNGLMAFNNKTAVFEQVPGMPGSQVFSLVPAGDEMLVPGDGLFGVRNKKAYTVGKSVGADLTLNGVYQSKKYPNILLGIGNFGVAVFQKQNKPSSPESSGNWHFEGYIPGIKDQLWSIVEDADGTIWAGTQVGRPYHVTLGFDETGNIDLKKATFEIYGPEQGYKNGLGIVYSIKGKNYFIGDSAIYTFDDKQKKFNVDSTFGSFYKGGGNTEFDMAEDNKGRVWIRFGKEIRLAIPKAGGGYSFDTTLLREVSELTIQKIYPEENGIVWLCTTDGLIRFDENLEKENDISFSTLIRLVSAGKKFISTTSSGAKSFEVAYQNNTLRFEYAAPFYVQEEKTLYQTWLEGFDKGWSEWGNNYYKEFTNLPQGNYKFHVRAMNIYQKVSDEAIYDFTINPPWFQTWWAYLLYAIAAFAIIYAVVRYRTKQLHEKHRELEKTVSERTAELSQRVEELAVINSVQEALVSALDMQAIYNLVGDRIREVFDAQAVIIATFDHDNGIEHFRYAIENGERFYPNPRSLDKLRLQLIQTRQKIVIKTAKEAFDWFGKNTVAGTRPLMSGVFVPLIIGEKITSYISLQNVDREDAFKATDIRLLETLANSMSVALENARLFDETTRLLKETEQRTAELAVINSVQEGLVREMDMQGIYDLVGDRVQKLFSAQAVIIASFDLANKTEHFNYLFENGQKFKPGPRPVNEMRQMLIDKKRTIYIETEEKARTEYGITAIEGTKMPKSLLFVPLLSGNDIRGYVSLQNIDIEHAFSESNIRLLETLANSMTVALENARLFEETNRLLKETEQRKAELAVINTVQEGLVREMDMQAIYELMGTRLCELFNTQTVMIRTFDTDAGTETWRYAIERGERMYSNPRPLIWANQELIKTKKYILINENYLEVARSYGGSGVTKGLPPKSAVFVPLIVADTVRGSVSLQNVEIENAFSESDVRLLTTLSNSMSVALENARLFEETKLLLAETEKGKKNVELLSDIGKKITASLDFETIFYKLYEHINQLADATVFGVGIYHPNLEQVEYKFAIERGQRYKPYSRDTTDKNQLPVWCIENRLPVFINDLPKEYSRYINKYDTKEILLEDGSVSTDPLSVIYLPLIVKDQVLGIITIQSFKKNAYTDYHLNLLQNLATYTSIALDNAKAYRQLNEREQEIGQRAAELSTVNSISQAMASQLDPAELINLVGNKMRDLFKANIVYVAILDHKSKIISFPYQYGDDLKPMKLGEGLTSQILLSGKPLLINKDVKEQTDKLGLQRIGLPAASYLGVPIPVGDEIIGVLSIQTTEAENRFNENDQRLLSTIATSVGVALRNAKLFEEVQHAKMDAEEARKNAEKANEAKSAFLSTVSHELRTPLTSVLGFAKIIRKRLEEKIFPLTDKTDVKTSKTIQQVSENLAVVVSEGERLTTLINDVLDLAKIEAGKMEWNFENISMPEIAERAIAATSSLFDQKNLVLEKHIESDLPLINGDKDKLIQVIVNLISNAVKFTPTGTITCNVNKKGEEIIVSITDTGIGIAKEDFKAVFEQFRQVGGDTLTDKPKGTGLGLPICKEIIEHHGGRIWLESEQGQGSSFFFALPLTNTNAFKPMHLDDLVKQLKVQMAQSQLHIKGKNITILVVDDDDSIRSLLQQEFADAGYNVDEASNGKQALERIRNNRPDLIILDIMMPEMNGFDVAAILKNDPQTMDIPIIVLSIVQDKARGYRIGVDRYLTKPIDTAALFAEVGTLLEQGKSSKKVMVVDEDSAAVKTLTDVLQAKGYTVVESDGKELMEKAISAQPDIIILNSVLSGKQEIVQSLRFEKGLENVLFLIYQ